jgi:hypothetical protein
MHEASDFLSFGSALQKVIKKTRHAKGWESIWLSNGNVLLEALRLFAFLVRNDVHVAVVAEEIALQKTEILENIVRLTTRFSEHQRTTKQAHLP